MGEPQNEFRLTGRIVEAAALRYTPAGVPVIEFRIEHASRQTEAGVVREVECEMTAVALGPNAGLLARAGVGGQVKLTGFVAHKSLRNRKPVLHVNTIEFVEGNENGVQTQDGSQA